MKEKSAISFRTFHLFQILRQFEKESLPLDRFLNHYFRTHTALGSKDRKYLADTVYGMTRWQLLLDHISGDSSLEKRYAIFEAFQPSHFLAVNTLEPHVRVSFPKELFDLLKASYGEEKALHLCQISNTKAPLCIRINPLKTTREVLRRKFGERFLMHFTKKSEMGIQFVGQHALTVLEEYKEGLFEIQDEASQLVSALIPVQPGEQILDYCAGSGGKSLAIAHKMQGIGQIYIHDIRPQILIQAKKRAARAGVINIHFCPPHDSELKKLKGKMDCVIVDVPCSGSGTLRRHPEQKWRFSLEKLKELVVTQRTIFEEALSYVRPGGKIFYATCSLFKEENEDQIAFFLKNYPVRLTGPLFKSELTYEGMDGFFAATFVAE